MTSRSAVAATPRGETLEVVAATVGDGYRSRRSRGSAMCTPRVLVVEDDEAIRDSIAEILVDEGYEVSLAADGWAGLLTARARRPDVVVLDLVMPGMSGSEYLAASHADPALAEVPVVLMTATAELSDATAAATLGVAAVCVKPFRAHRLLRAIERLTPCRCQALAGRESA